MPTPKYCLALSGNDLNQSEVSCTGEQLSLLLGAINETTNNFMWFASDVSGVNIDQYWETFSSGKPQPVDSKLDVCIQLIEVEQFLSGVFFVTDADLKPLFQLEHYTEDDRFTDIEDAIIQIRAFDTTVFEVYSSDINLIEILKEKFGGKLLVNS
ncbi:hypothetical protein OE749_17475 [Aestuariibacter sp. AA17]|uniref:Uncharacterized protein n=1 Tax=Fluctibacter corallii TaxID=2984329 RepID=A0ABT3ACY0_9ALTE|nr:hypothetical protein [Aestuariibacter sp. AA17]MCV2886490.1 hypothetical protein [Aestuariibacter sp. AA17]